MGMTKDQREDAKKNFVAQVMKNIGDLTSLGGPDLKVKIREVGKKMDHKLAGKSQGNASTNLQIGSGYDLDSNPLLNSKNNVIGNSNWPLLLWI
jgi:hypothetical protein